MELQYFVSTHDEGRTAPIVIDVVTEDGTGLYAGRSMACSHDQYPNVVIMSHDDYRAYHDKVMTTEPVEITDDEFNMALEALPPLNWRRSADHRESFMMSEYISGTITSIYCYMDGKYYRFNGSSSLTHEEICQRCTDMEESKR